jgi:UDP-GlcNAc:undecaprenyl-phosphate/decaprenyl-phosphate GlcNAc-1-phosphate transferase
VLSVLIAAAVTLLALWPFRRIAARFGFIDRPGPRKAHTEAVPYLGGIAILAGAATSLVLFSRDLWAVLILLALVTLVGLVDDIRFLPVWAKLIGEGVIASSAVALGFSLQLTDSTAVNAGLSVLWIVGLTNSFNLLDNMDGLAATAAAGSLIAIAAIVPAASGLALPLAGGAIGFFPINRPPAIMDMGDAGSLMLGVGVALASIVAANTTHGLHAIVILAFPVALALFDTSLVIVSRLSTGRPIQLGGQDHFSHRLRLLGWGPYQVLGAALVASIASSACAAFAVRYPLDEAWLAVPIGVAILGAWVALLRVDPYTVALQPKIEVLNAKTPQ